jgi:Carboxypeptidase regulatory-like domain
VNRNFLFTLLLKNPTQHCLVKGKGKGIESQNCRRGTIVSCPDYILYKCNLPYQNFFSLTFTPSPKTSKYGLGNQCVNYFLISLLINTFSVLTSPAFANPIVGNPQLSTPASNTESPKDIPNTFPVGLNIEKRNINPSVLVRGEENGRQAINFQDWLVPYDAVIQALKLNITTLSDGQLEVRSPGIITRIDPKKIRSDAELGLVFSIQDLQTLFGVKAKFDIKEYAIVLDIPWINQTSQSISQKPTPIQLQGLPLIAPANFSIAAVEQKVNASGTQSTSPSYRGDFTAVGTAFGGSWFLRTDQPSLENQASWKIAEAQFLQQSDRTDYILGSQPTFWQSQAAGNFWGFTFVQRKGFVPPQSFGGFVDTRQRLQAAQIGRTISGKAEPGTLVRLTENLGDRIISEVLVDSSGIYRFENIKDENQFFSSSYRVLLYPQGRLTAQPEIREANYSTVPGQLPAGATALVVSGGLKRNIETQNLRGGIAQRWGLSENLTVGLGGIYDESAKAMAELFYRPANLPLQVAISTITGNNWDINADIRYDPSPNLSASFTSDRFSRRFNLDWRVSNALSLFASNDSRDATAGGIQFNFSGRDAFTFGRASIDTENRFRWNLLQRLGKLEFSQRGNEIGTLTEFTYNLSENNLFNAGSSLLLNYETRSQNRSDNLLTLGWRYRSEQRAIDGNYFWEAQLGYGLGSQGAAPIATLSTTVLPGILLRARYQGISVTTDESTFSLDLVSSLGLQRGITPGDRRADYFRTQGGLLIQPFFDKNNNGKRDSTEEAYTDSELFTINNRRIKSFQPYLSSDRIMVRLSPDTYRLQLDPAGFPPDWQVTLDALAVKVVAGSYTTVSIPLTRSYTRSGVITDSQGNAVAGARVEAIQANSTKNRFSVTNGAGVYYLEGLQQGEYKLQINGKSISNLKLEGDSQPFQELNLKYGQ